MSEFNVLLESWNKVKELDIYKQDIIGVNMMIYIFTNNPSIKYLWKFAANLTNETEIRDCPQTKKHGKNVMRSVDALLKRLSENKIEDAEKLLVDLGHRHIKYGAKTEHIPIIGTALVETIKNGLGEAFTKEVNDSWSSAISFVASNVAKGLEQ